MKKFLIAFFLAFIEKPGRLVFRFVFYKIIVKLYTAYRSLLNKLGWNFKKKNPFAFLLSQKLTHIFVISITVIMVFLNLTSESRAYEMPEKAHLAIVANLVQGEFGENLQEEIVEEFSAQTDFTQTVPQTYQDGSLALRSQPKATISSFSSVEDITQINQGGAAILKPDIASTEESIKERTKTIEYTVEPGDTISTIAQKFAISVNTILWENNLSAYSLIRPGDNLIILPVSGVTHTVKSGENLSKIAVRYNVTQGQILTANKITDEAKIAIGQKLLIPGGSKIATPTYSSQTNYSSISAIKSVVKPDSAPPAANKMNWPTDGSRITQYYSWRHQGLDIANKTGTPIYAADAGTIELAGWNNGYGYNIVINHGGGKKTRYAHLSKFHVTVDQSVGKGETIGEMGSTGWSTGPHLHFEVIINGSKYNPLNYIQ